MKVATICYCIEDGKVLLGMKKIRFGAGKWNGFGGKVEAGEDIPDAARREVEEECGLRIPEAHVKQVATLSFYFAETPMFECHVFFADKWDGETHESDEMIPQWFALDALPFDKMWFSDLFWLPAVLAGATFKGTCHFDQEGKAVERFEIERAEF